jgi:hypothetical protein
MNDLSIINFSVDAYARFRGTRGFRFYLNKAYYFLFKKNAFDNKNPF